MIKKYSIFQFQVGYIKYPNVEKHRTHGEQVIKMIQYEFK